MNDEEKLYVVNRDGEHEDVHFDTITEHVKRLMKIHPVLEDVDEALLATKAIQSMIPGIKTREINDLLAEESACMARQSDQYVVLAGRIAIDNLHKDVDHLYGAQVKGKSPSLTYTMVVDRLYKTYYNTVQSPMISGEIHSFMCDTMDIDPSSIMQRARKRIEDAIDHTLDYKMYTYFGIMTLIRKYLSKNLTTDILLELPQHMLMTVSLGIHGIDNIDDALQTYDLMSRGFFTHATPTLLNGGRLMNQMASCYLLTMTEDSIPDIAECMRRCMVISQGGGGIGISASSLRARGSIIKKVHGIAHGVCHELLRVFNSLALYVDQGGGKRKGAIAFYLEPWHADVEEFVDLRSNSGSMDMKCNDIHLGLWINDLFMERVLTNEQWSLFCPADAPGLCDTYGEEFETLYLEYEKKGLARKTVSAVELWYKILDKQQEVSEPYMLYKDACNRKSNQKNLGTIRGSNLCTEIIQYTSKDEIAVCVLMSFALPKYVVLACETERIEEMRKEYGEEEVEQICKIEGTEDYYDFIMLARHVAIGVKNLNRVIDRMHYPDKAARKSSTMHRAVGVGVQGLADVFGMFEIAWNSKVAREINHDVFHTIYEAALRGSMECAKIDGPYETYEGSPASKGIFQPELWQNEEDALMKKYTEKYDECYAYTFVTPANRTVTVNENLKKEIAEHGLRNSLLVAPMPTASTAQILGNFECMEPCTSNIYTRATGAGDFIVYNKHLVHSLKKRGLWDAKMRNAIYSNSGSVQNVDRVPEYLKKVYKTVWEIKQSRIIELAAERGHYIDQSQSLNIHVSNPTRAVLNTLHFLVWRMKLKGSYYIRRQSASSPTSFTSVSIAAPAGEMANRKRSHDEEHEEGNGEKLAIQAKKSRIQGACPLNSAVGEGDPDACDMCSG